MPPKSKKEQVLSLADFASIAGGNSSSGSWADDEGDFTTFQTSSAMPPTAGGTGPSLGAWMSGAASTGGGSSAFMMSSSGGPQAPVPDAPPYTARVGNVSYDVTEQIIHDFFTKEHGLSVESVRLPRGDDGRVRGSAYVDFSTRDGLVSALKLGGTQILGRTVSVNTVDQRGPSSGGFGGGGSFDWSRRAETGPTDGSGLGSFGRGPPGAGAGASGASGDRFDRFRPKNTQSDEQSFNWGTRAGPTDGSGLGNFGGHHREHREPREPREPQFQPDWSARAGATTGAAAHRSAPKPEPSFDWSRREAREPRESSAREFREHREPRAPREPQPTMDWSKRAEPAHRAARNFGNPRAAQRDAGPALDWGKRASAGATPSAYGARSSASSSAPAPAPAPAAGTPAAKKTNPALLKMQRGFNALSIDDDEEEAANSTSSGPKPAVEAKSIAEIQQEQRETSNEGWSKA